MPVCFVAEMPCGDQVTQEVLRETNLSRHTEVMALFFPSITPTRRKRWQMPWAAIAGVLSAALSVWMIVQVHTLHKQREEKKLDEMFAPKQEQRPTSPARVKESPRLTLATQGRVER
jgi:hypothetical protein